MTMTAQDYEAANRTRKCLAILETLRAADYDWTADDVDRFTEAEWGMLADAAGVREPSEVTRSLVVNAMQRDEARQASADDEDDPFQGL